MNFLSKNFLTCLNRKQPSVYILMNFIFAFLFNFPLQVIEQSFICLCGYSRDQFSDFKVALIALNFEIFDEILEFIKWIKLQKIFYL